jgi:hypothetical protein
VDCAEWAEEPLAELGPVVTLDRGRGILLARVTMGMRVAELLKLEFDGLDETDYAAANAQLGLDPKTGYGDWPAGLITHVAGVDERGSAYVIEVWESQQAQVDFMESRRLVLQSRLF